MDANKTGISESQLVQGVLQALILIVPFFGVEMTIEQMQAAATLAGMIAAFTWAQRRKQKVKS